MRIEGRLRPFRHRSWWQSWYVRVGRVCLSAGWSWRWLWRHDCDGWHVCVLGVLLEVSP